MFCVLGLTSATFVHCKDNSSAPAASLKSLDDDEHVDQHTCDFTCVVYIGKVDLDLAIDHLHASENILIEMVIAVTS